MSNGKLSVYEVTVNGFKTKMQMTEAEARKRGLAGQGDAPVSEEPAPVIEQETAPVKEPSPAPKPTGKKTTKQEGDE